MKRAAILLVLAATGCVQVAITTDESKGPTMRQDVGRTTASTESSSGTQTSTTQTADGKLEVPVSVVPK